MGELSSYPATYPDDNEDEEDEGYDYTEPEHYDCEYCGTNIDDYDDDKEII